MTFDSHVFNLVDVASRLVNELTPGLRGGHEVAAPRGATGVAAVAEALGGNGRRTPHVTARQADGPGRVRRARCARCSRRPTVAT